MTHPVPVIDLRYATGPAAPAHVLERVRIATETTGAIQVVNHGVPQHLINDFNHRIARLLSQPRSRKSRLASPTGHPYRGWRRRPDDFGRLEIESFGIGQFDNVAHARSAGLATEHLGLYAHANVWPADDPRLRYTAFRYLDAAREVAERVLGLYARTQGLPAGTFPASELPHLSLTVNGYPTWSYPDPGDDEDKLLLLEHSDASAVTVLAQDGDHEGLRVQDPGGEWVTVPAVPGALVVFSGTLLARWTNGRLRPARQRVVAGGNVPRRSAAVYYYPALGTALEPLPEFVGPGEHGDYEPVTTWDVVTTGVADHLAVIGRPRQPAVGS